MSFFKSTLLVYHLLIISLMYSSIVQCMESLFSEKTSKYHRAPLRTADELLNSGIGFGAIVMVEDAIKNGADLNLERASDYSTPLSQAIEAAESCFNQNVTHEIEDRLYIIELLIKGGADINKIIAKWNSSPLEGSLLTANPQLPIIRLLLQYSAEIDEEWLDLETLSMEIKQELLVHKHLRKN